MVWEPKTCCCATPRVGALILGWLGVIGSTLNVVGLLRYVTITREDITASCANITKEMDQNIMDTNTCVKIVYGSIGFSAVVGLLGIIICGLLIWGINKYKPAMMLPYMITQGIGIALLIIVGLLLTSVLIYVQQWLAALFFVIIYGLLTFLDVYFFLVIRVCYKEVKQHSVAMGQDSNIVYVEQKVALYPQM